MELFFKENYNAIYEYMVGWWYGIGMGKSSFNPYNFRCTFWDCKEMFENELQKSIEDGVKIDGIHRVFFYKRWGNNANVDIEMNCNMEIMKVNSYHSTKLASVCGMENYLLTQEEFNIDDIYDDGTHMDYFPYDR